MAEEKQCVLVLIGADEWGRKEIIGLADGYRESTQSWRELLLGLKSRGLIMPKLATGDGAMGFWAALEEVCPTTRQQRCWMHKTGNVLNYLPKRTQPKAKKMLHDIWQAETREDAHKAFDLFIDTFEAKYPKAAECLIKDRDELLTFYDFPAQHWQSIRTSNPIESAFATIRRIRTRVSLDIICITWRQGLNAGLRTSRLSSSVTRSGNGVSAPPRPVPPPSPGRIQTSILYVPPTVRNRMTSSVLPLGKM